MSKRDKTTGLPLPSPVDPGSTVCVQMVIPNAPEYRQALRGVISDLGKYWTWSQTQGQSSDPALEAAELWRAAAMTITYADECGEPPMSCADVADCIEAPGAAHDAVQQIVGNQATPGMQAPPGGRLPDSVWAANQADDTDCDYDKFWPQARRFVDYLVQAGLDFLEQIELYTNSIEAAGFVETIPVIGTMIDEAQIDQVLEALDWAIEVIQEAFVAADNEPNRVELACAIFCAMRDECSISFEAVFDVINSRLGGVLDPSDLETLDDLLEAAVTISQNPAVPLDAWLAFVLGMSRVLSYLGIAGIEKTVNIMLKVAASTPDDGWILLCEDCPPPSEGPWILLPALDNPFSSGQPVGTIISQTATTVIAEASLGGDGIYRLALKRTDHCGTTTGLAWDGPTPTGSTGCGAYVGGVLPDAPGAFYDRFYTEGTVPYGVELSYSA